LPRRAHQSLTAAGNRSSVDVFIGSGGHGHTFPGATAPWGMVQATPWTHKAGVSPWDTQSGYHAKARDPAFYGMAHSALSGAGTGEMGELRLLPTLPRAGEPMVLLSETADASPGYFAAEVRPQAANYSGTTIHIRSSATPRGAVHEFVFPDEGPRSVKVALSAAPNSFWGWTLQAYRSQVVSERRFEGCMLGAVTGIGGANAHLCFVVEFDQDFTSPVRHSSPSSAKSHTLGPEADVAFAFPEGGGKRLVARVAVSRTDLPHARAAFDSEVAGRSLEQILEETRSRWDKALGTVRVKMKSTPRKRILYTALYHSMISPNLLSDADGSYRLQKATPGTFPRKGVSVSFENLDERLPRRKAKEGGSIYHTFSIWDTYRSLHPLMNLVHPEVSRHFGDSLMAFLGEWGYLPCWQLVHSPTDMMEGDGGSVILSTMAMNGLVNKEEALEALQAGRTRPVDDKRRCLGSPECLRDKISELLEQAKADRCVARLAERLGRQDVADRFTSRSRLAFEAWDSRQGIFAPLAASGNSSSFASVDPNRASVMYKEGSPIQYAWSAEFDIQKMVELRQGEEGFACALDRFFYGSKAQTGVVDMTGSFGALSLGNEPTMHVPYLYSLAGYPSRTQELVGRLMQSFFSDRANGLPGNDDLGQTSSWAIFTMLGLYPVDPCAGEYALGRPFVEEAELSLGKGKLKIKVNGQSDKNMYVQRLQWAGKDLDVARPKLTFDMISAGGLLEFWMSSEPPDNQKLECSPSGGSLHLRDGVPRA